MVGSKKWFAYTDDRGTLHGIFLDESNTEAVNAGNNDIPDVPTLIYALPRNLKARRLVYQNSAGTRTISCVALTPTIYNNAETGVPSISDPFASGETLSLVRKEPEKLTVIKGIDTGLNDGDST